MGVLIKCLKHDDLNQFHYCNEKCITSGKNGVHVMLGRWSLNLLNLTVRSKFLKNLKPAGEQNDTTPR